MEINRNQYSKIIIISFSIFLSSITWARIRDFETTRLKSTAGTGVGSILMEESSILNPAPIAFFNVASIYFQKADGEIKSVESDNPHTPPASSDQMAVILSESNQRLSGSISYQQQKDDFSERQRIGISASSKIKDRSAFGITTRLTTDRISTDKVDYKKVKYNQIIAGVTHVISPHFSIGLTFIDPLKTKKEDTRAVVGTQYVYREMISLMMDVGADYTQNLSQTTSYHGALQIKVYGDFFVRAGIFNDKSIMEKGNGVGIGWVAPKLLLEFALKNTTIIENEKLAQNNQNLTETSFSISYRF
ncbi:MAG: hypothetical protein KAQ98_01625 [Bacteriovoracaceae bacterium]|nr:hypothetical protein [Bacteriovoracaceae bacterium]